jgi:hypothetical protein
VKSVACATARAGHSVAKEMVYKRGSVESVATALYRSHVEVRLCREEREGCRHKVKRAICDGFHVDLADMQGAVCGLREGDSELRVVGGFSSRETVDCVGSSRYALLW